MEINAVNGRNSKVAPLALLFIFLILLYIEFFKYIFEKTKYLDE